MSIPIASVIGAVSITKTTAILTGKLLDDNSPPYGCQFIYGALGADLIYIEWEDITYINDIISARIIGLTPSTQYAFAVIANYEGASWSEFKYFTTLSSTGTNPIGYKIALELVRNVEMSVGGHAFMDKEGKFHYDSRNARHL